MGHLLRLGGSHGWGGYSSGPGCGWGLAAWFYFWHHVLCKIAHLTPEVLVHQACAGELGALKAVAKLVGKLALQCRKVSGVKCYENKWRACQQGAWEWWVPIACVWLSHGAGILLEFISNLWHC